MLTTQHNTLIVASLAQALRLDGEVMDRLLSRAPQLVVGVLVVLLGARAAVLVTDLAQTPAANVTASPAGPAIVRNEVDIPSILRSNLFGQAISTDSGSAPVTNVALVLAGVVAAMDPLKGFALLGPSATAVKIYEVGSVVPGGVKLHSVYPDRVLLDRGGTIEALMLPRQPTAAGNAGPVPAMASTGAIQRVQQLVRDNPGIIGEIIRPQAVLAEGRQRGYRVFPGPDVAAFTRLGLRPGDLVTAINGTALDDPSQGGQIFATLGSVAEARVTVTRNGSQQDLILNLAEVAAEAERLNQPGGGAPPPTGSPGMGQAATPAAAR